MVRLARDAMRTRFEIVLADDADPVRLRAAGEEALDEIARVESQLSAYQPQSDLFCLNQTAAREPVRVDGRVWSFLQRAQELTHQTDGAFDLTAGALLACWRFTESTQNVPNEKARTKALACVGMERVVELHAAAQTVRFTQPGVRLDPGAIGKGYAIERAAELLGDAGIQNALLHGGTSTVYGLGAPPNAEAWTVAIQDPRDPQKHIAVARLCNQALSVSAVHGKSFWAQNRRFGHVLDPRTGWPVENALLAAVCSPSATDSDALSTALLVLGAPGFASLKPQTPALFLDEAGTVAQQYWPAS